jgi:Glycosyl transferases group 1/Glycosyltransferase Family 4
VVSLHIDTGYEMRGGQWQVLYLLRGLVAKGQQIRLLAPEGSDLLQAALAQRLVARPLGLPALLSASYGADLVHAHDARAHTLGLMVGKPLVVSRRVAFPVGRGFPSRWKYQHATHFIAISEFVKNRLLERALDEERITVVYDGVPIPPRSESIRRHKILAIDSDDPGKGRTTIEKAAALAGIPVSFSKNLSRDLPEAAVFVYITESEGLGSAALLAMAHGVPVIASAVGGLPEIVEDEKTGLLTSNDPESIAQQIRRALDDHALAGRLSRCARTRAEQQFSSERMTEETMRVYENLGQSVRG